MAENAKMIIEMILDDKEALAKLRTSLGKLERDSKSTTDSMSAGFKKVAVEMAATVVSYQAIKNFAEGSIKQAMEQEDAVNRLNVALKNQGTFTVGLSQNYQEMANSIQRSTRFSDDAILQAQQTLITLGNVGPSQMAKVTTAVTDFATATRRDLQSSAELFARAAQGNTVALQKMGITIDENIPKGQKLNELIKLTARDMGGSAVADTRTFSGALDQLGNSFHELQESIGDMLIKTPEVIAFFQTIRENIELTKNAIDSGGGAAGFFQQLQEGFTAMVQQNNGNALGVLHQMFFGTEGDAEAFKQKVSDATLAASQTAVTNFQATVDQTAPIRDSFIQSFEEGFGKLDQGSSVFFAEFAKNVGTATKQATVMFSQTMTQILFHQKSVGEAFKQLGMQIVEMFTQMAIQMAVQKALALAFNAVLGGASAATGALVAAAWAPAAALVSLATFGTNAAAAAGALTSTIALSRGLATLSSIIPGAAEGGTVNNSGSVLVGERGPEILNLPRGASVIPLDRNRGGNNFNIVVEMNNPVISSNQIADEFAQAIAERVSAFIDNERARL